MGLFEKLFGKAENSIKIDPPSIEKLEDKPRKSYKELMDELKVQITDQKYDDAIKTCDIAIQVDRDDPRAWQKKAEILSKMGKFDEENRVWQMMPITDINKALADRNIEKLVACMRYYNPKYTGGMHTIDIRNRAVSALEKLARDLPEDEIDPIIESFAYVLMNPMISDPKDLERQVFKVLKSYEDHEIAKMTLAAFDDSYMY